MKKFKLKSLATLVIVLVIAFTGSACTTDVVLDSSYSAPPPPPPTQQAPARNISKQEARHIALHHAGVTPKRATFEKVVYNQNSNTYKIKFYTPNRVFHYSINAKNGNIRNFDIKNRGKNNQRR